MKVDNRLIRSADDIGNTQPRKVALVYILDCTINLKIGVKRKGKRVTSDLSNIQN